MRSSGAAPLAAILHSAVPAAAAADEQDTLVQRDCVSQALTALGYAAVSLPFTRDPADVTGYLQRLCPEVIFNLVESIAGSGRLVHVVPALLDALGLRYTGCTSQTQLITSQKLLAKRLMREAGIPTPEWIDSLSLAAKQALPTGTLIVKSVWEHASFGLDAESVVATAERAAARIDERARRFGGQWFAERFIEGREFNIAMLASEAGPEVLPIAEMRFADFPEHYPRIVDYAAKWDPQSFAYQYTQRCFPDPQAQRDLLANLAGLALRCWNVFALNGYARVDIRLDEGQRPWVLEVNANPCLAPDGGFAAAAAKRGLSLTDVIVRILDDCPAVTSAPTAET
ncbi:MAG: ATP-grasp domain-containing protein [Gammaproteobacteria bacterium]